MRTLRIKTDDKAVKIVCEKDPVMKKLIILVGDLKISLRTDYLQSIVRSIVGQQISVRGAKTIYDRLLILLEDEITVEALLNTPIEDLRQIGFSMRKVEYVKDLATKIAANELDLENLASYDNDEIIKQLTNVKGIGKWTAEMFLLLTFGRDDVLAIDDVGIQRAARWLYEVEKSERRKILIEKSPLWKPYRSIVSFYLWEAIHLGYVAEYASINELGGDER